MIWLQAIWAAILAALLGYTFRRAWRWEHGAEARLLVSGRHGNETFVFLPPTTFFWILLVFFVLFLWRLGAQEGVLRFLSLAADMTLLICVYYALLLALLPLLRRWISARACAVLWLAPAFLSWQANNLLALLPMPRWTVYLPRRTLLVLGAVWLAGFLCVGAYYLICHLLFLARVRKTAQPVQDEAVLAIWRREREALGYRLPTALLQGDVPGPFSMGRTRWSRCTVLPARSFTQEELSMIFCHELHHLQRCDVDTKVFLCLCRALCWFNPLVWIAARKAADDLERSCDEIVTEPMDDASRMDYARLLLSSAGPDRGCTTCLSAAAGTLRHRLKGVTDRRRRRLGTAVVMAALFLCVMCFGLVSVSDARGSFSELILPDGTQIEYVFDGSATESACRDDAQLRAVLDGARLEHVAGLRSPVLTDESVTLVLSGIRYAELSRRVLIIQDHRTAPDCYLVEGLDWDALRACLR